MILSKERLLDTDADADADADAGVLFEKALPMEYCIEILYKDTTILYLE